MRKFSNYIQFVHPEYFSEMALAKEEKQLKFDDKDSEYLANFINPDDDDKLKLLWLAKAIAYRYSDKVLKNPDPEVRDITLETNYGGKQLRRTFPNVKVYGQHLIEKMHKLGYDPNKYNIVRWAATNAAQKELKFIKGETDKRANLSPIKADKDAAVAEPTANPKPDYMHYHDKPVSQEKVYLDDDDKKFLASFDKPGYSKFKVQAFMRRYSDEIINDPRAKENNGEGYTMVFTTSRGRQIEIPVNLNYDALRKRLDDLKEKGVDFESRPLNFASAQRWVKGRPNAEGQIEHFYQPGKKIRMSTSSFQARASYNSLKSYEDAQKAYLNDPDENPSPIIADWNPEALHDFNYDVPWGEILRQESEIATSRALRMMKSKLSDAVLRRVEPEDIANQVWSYLSTDELVTNEDYASQRFRIEKATAMASQLIKDTVGGKMRQSNPDIDVADKRRSDDGDSDSISMDDLKPQMKDYLAALPLFDKIDSKDEDEVVDSFMDNLKKFVREKGRKPSGPEMYALGQDTLEAFSKSVISMAAQSMPRPKPANPVMAPKIKAPLIKAPEPKVEPDIMPEPEPERKPEPVHDEIPASNNPEKLQWGQKIQQMKHRAKKKSADSGPSLFGDD